MKTRKSAFVKFLSFLPLIALLGILFTACDKDKASPRKGSANVMAVHASPDAKPATFYLDRTKISAGTLAYGQASNYVSTTSGSRKAEFRGDGNAVIAAKQLDLGSKKSYTVFLAGTVAAADVVMLEDDLTPPSAGKAKVRFVNLSPDDTKMDIKVTGGNVLATGRGYKSVSNFLEADPGTVHYEVLNSQDNSVLLSMPGFTLDAGKIYTIWVKGSKNGVGDAALSANLIVHNR